MIKSLLYMIANNICQIAYLNAQLHGTNPILNPPLWIYSNVGIERVFFAGGFIQGNEYLWSRLAYGIDFWSKSRMKALFLTHDGYLGAVGAFLAASNDSPQSV